MKFKFDESTEAEISKVRAFMLEHIYPLEKSYREFAEKEPREVYPHMEGLKEKAKSAGLWNLFLPKEYGDYSPVRWS